MPVRIPSTITTPRMRREALPVVGLAAATITVGTLLIAILEQATEIPDASAVYLVAVVIVGWIGGTIAAVGTAAVAFLVYDLLFTDPRLSLVVADPSELLNLILVLIVAVAIGHLAALGRQRAAEADRRAAEATGLFAVSRLLATAEATEAVAGEIVERLRQDAGLERVWIGLDGGARERVLADSGSGPIPVAAITTTLVRTPGDEPARWVRAHDGLGRDVGAARPTTGGGLVRIGIQAGGSAFGSLWALQASRSGVPGPEATQLLSLAADQIALGLRRDRLRQEALAAEVARRSDALKSALLDSVSHDLRTPLASIRATAGNLADPAMTLSRDDIRRAAEIIDGEVRRLDRLVRSVLDLSRIESGALQPDVELYDAAELVDRAVARLAPELTGRRVTVDIADDLPLLRVDAVLFDAIVSNVLDNVADHTPAGAPVVIGARAGDGGRVLVTIEDGGPGVPEADLTRIFEKFGRAGQPGERARRGMGVGLSIVRGMTEALGGAAVARRSDLGGLAIELDLPGAPGPPVHESVR